MQQLKLDRFHGHKPVFVFFLSSDEMNTGALGEQC